MKRIVAKNIALPMNTETAGLLVLSELRLDLTRWWNKCSALLLKPVPKEPYSKFILCE